MRYNEWKKADFNSCLCDRRRRRRKKRTSVTSLLFFALVFRCYHRVFSFTLPFLFLSSLSPSLSLFRSFAFELHRYIHTHTPLPLCSITRLLYTRAMLCSSAMHLIIDYNHHRHSHTHTHQCVFVHKHWHASEELIFRIGRASLLPIVSELRLPLCLLTLQCRLISIFRVY